MGSRVLRNNKNFLVAVTGQTGIGKSWASGSICELYSKMYGIPHDPNEQMFFDMKTFLKLINSDEADKKIKFGSILMFDESQIQINARKWQSEANQIMAQLVSTFRNKRLIVLFPTPYIEFLDKQTRVLFHAEFMIQGYDKNKKITKIYPRFLEYNKRKDDFYRKRLEVEYKVKDKPVYTHYKVHDWVIPKPSDDWINIYEPMKLNFTKQLNKELLNKVEDKKEKETQETKDFFEIEQIVKEKGEDYQYILSQKPHIPPFKLEKYIQFLKRREKSQKTTPNLT